MRNRFTALLPLVVVITIIPYFLSGCDGWGGPGEGAIQIDTSDTDPEHVTWGGDRSACHEGKYNEVVSQGGDNADRHSTDGKITVDNSDYDPIFEVNLIGYKPCVDGVCTGEVFGVARFDACIVNSDYPDEPQCTSGGFDGDLSGHPGWFLWQGVVAQNGAQTSRIEAVFGNQFAPATARMMVLSEEPMIEWDFIQVDYPEGTTAPFPSDDYIGQLVFSNEDFDPTEVGGSQTSLADSIISADSAIYDSFSGFVACQN